MKKLIIKKEKLATKCEICHKTDKFNAKKNYCKRCYKYDPEQINKKQINFIKKLERLGFVFYKALLLAIIPCIFAVLTTFIVLIFVGVLTFTVSLFLKEIELENLPIFLFQLMEWLFFLLTLTGFIVGFVSGISFTLNIFRKSSDITNLDLSNVNSENQPYYMDSKNIYS